MSVSRVVVDEENGQCGDVERGREMNISAEILEHELHEKVLYKNIIPTRTLQLKAVRFITKTEPQKYDSGQVYVCKADDLPLQGEVPRDSCIVCMGGLPPEVCEQYRNNTIITVNMSDFSAFSNILLGIFEKYGKLEKNLEEHFQTSKQIDDRTMDLMTELIGMPLCIMDANYNVFAFTQKIKPIDDKLWNYLEKGYGYHYYDIVCKSKPRLEEVAKAENGEIEMINNISGSTLRVKAIYVNGVPMAFLGMHPVVGTKEPFQMYTVQLFDYVIDYMRRKSNLLKRMQKSRGKPYEKILEDLISGQGDQIGNIDECLDSTNIVLGDFYMIGIIYFEAETPMAYNHIAMMDYIENMFKTSRCIKYENLVVILTSLRQNEVFERKIPICTSELFVSLLEECGGRVIFSWPFENIMDVPYVYRQLKEVKEMEMIKRSPETVVRYGAYSIALVMKQMQELHILGVLGSSAIRKLSYHDHINNTELYYTLKMYLKNNCSISVTANAMHLHRNTLQYRLRQIESVTDIDFDNPNIRARLLYAIDATDYLQGTYR